MTRSPLLIASVLLVSFAFSLPTRAWTSENSAINTKALELRFIGEIETLQENEKTVPLETLQQQLEKSSTDKQQVSLPAISATGDLKEGLPQLYKQCQPSVLIIGIPYKCGKCDKWHLKCASGFALSESGLIVTNYHVVNKDQGATLAVMNHDGKVLPVVEVVAGNKIDDVAVLRVEGAKFQPLPLGKRAEVGSAVHVISHPDGRFYHLSTGIVSRYDIDTTGEQPKESISITAEYAQGSSGAPVINDSGEVVAIVESTATLYFQDDSGRQHPQMVVESCIPVDAIRKLIH